MEALDANGAVVGARSASEEGGARPPHQDSERRAASEDKHDRGATATAHNSSTDAKDAEKGSLSQAKKRPPPPRPASNFLCVPRYRCEPPEPPMDLKLMDFEPDVGAYAAYRPTELDLNYRRPLYRPATLNVRVDLANTDQYTPFTRDDELSASDRALLDVEGELAADGRGGHRRAAQPAPFLRAMFYDEYKVDKIDYTGSKLKREVYKPKTRDELIMAVKSDFVVARRKPVHPTLRKRHLEPVEVVPLFPDFENRFNKYVIVQFEEDPRRGVVSALRRNLQRSGDVPDAEVAEMIDTAVTIGSRGEDNEAFLCYYTPVDDTVAARKHARQSDAGPPPGREERYHTAAREIYQLVNEYSFDVKARESSNEVQRLFLLQSRLGVGYATYNELSSRLALHKRRNFGRAGAEATAGAAAPQVKRLVLERHDVGRDERAEQMDSVTRMCMGDDVADLASALEQPE